jgi:rubredoxin
MHEHKCQSCGTIWAHEEPEIETSIPEYHKRHNCPHCGQNERKRYIASDFPVAEAIADDLLLWFEQHHGLTPDNALAIILATGQAIARIAGSDIRKMLDLCGTAGEIILLSAMTEAKKK